MTSQSNFSFLLYIVSTDDAPAMRKRIHRALGCELRKTDTQGLEPMGLLDEECTTLGMHISFCWAYEWPQGNVYRLSGGTESAVWAEQGELVSLDNYIIRLLHSAGIETSMTRHEFISYRQRIGG